MEENKIIKYLNNIIYVLMIDNGIEEVEIPEEELNKDRVIMIEPNNFNYTIKKHTQD